MYINANEAANLMKEYKDAVRTTARSLVPGCMKKIDSLIRSAAANGKEIITITTRYLTDLPDGANDVIVLLTKELSDVLIGLGYRVVSEEKGQWIQICW